MKLGLFWGGGILCLVAEVQQGNKPGKVEYSFIYSFQQNLLFSQFSEEPIVTVPVVRESDVRI